jgi:hypothetical protein
MLFVGALPERMSHPLGAFVLVLRPSSFVLVLGSSRRISRTTTQDEHDPKPVRLERKWY